MWSEGAGAGVTDAGAVNVVAKDVGVVVWLTAAVAGATEVEEGTGWGGCG